MTPEELLRQLLAAWRRYQHNPWGGDKKLEELFNQVPKVLEKK